MPFTSHLELLRSRRRSILLLRGASARPRFSAAKIRSHRGAALDSDRRLPLADFPPGPRLGYDVRVAGGCLFSLPSRTDRPPLFNPPHPLCGGWNCYPRRSFDSTGLSLSGVIHGSVEFTLWRQYRRRLPAASETQVCKRRILGIVYGSKDRP